MLPDEDARLVRLSALLHDLGHGPFSHVSEGALEVYADRARLRGRLGPREKIHELVTQDLLRTDPDLLRLIGKSDLDKIQLLLSQGYGEPVLRSVVSGPLDADKQDYLLRDSYYCGVKYGIFDLQQLHRELRVVEDPADGHRVLAISADGVHALEQFVLAKYYLTGQVYSHRVRLITDQMLLRAITLAIDCDGIDELRQLYSYDGQDRFVRDYTEWDDARFMLEFGGAKHKGSYCQHLLVRLARRRLLKQVFESRVSRLPESCGERVETIAKPENRAGRRELEGRLAEACGAPAFN